MYVKLIRGVEKLQEVEVGLCLHLSFWPVCQCLFLLSTKCHIRDNEYASILRIVSSIEKLLYFLIRQKNHFSIELRVYNAAKALDGNYSTVGHRQDHFFFEEGRFTCTFDVHPLIGPGLSLVLLTLWYTNFHSTSSISTKIVNITAALTI